MSELGSRAVHPAMNVKISQASTVVSTNQDSTVVSEVRVRRRISGATATSEASNLTGVLRKVWIRTPDGVLCRWVVALGD